MRYARKLWDYQGMRDSLIQLEMGEWQRDV
jgi:hypothetical protein